ncbi:MAG: TlpA disulfide reductase family protein [Crocinitomicaceae bacterium]|jgi:thiol-disulfide isomerase/thioredoxin
MKKALLYIPIFFLIIYVGFFAYIKISFARPGEIAPDFEAKLIDGTHFKLSHLRGKYVLLDFWGSWCQPCRADNPSLVRLYSRHSDKLYIVTFALEKNEPAGVIVAKKDGFTWKHQIVEQSNLVLLSETARKYGVTSIPTKHLISPEGKMLGQMSFEQIDSLMLSL